MGRSKGREDTSKDLYADKVSQLMSNGDKSGVNVDSRNGASNLGGQDRTDTAGSALNAGKTQISALGAATPSIDYEKTVLDDISVPDETKPLGRSPSQDELLCYLNEILDESDEK